MNASCDVLIVGQGLVGTTLAFMLEKLGFSYIICHNPSKKRASDVAAGLINPITGKRLARSLHVEEYLSQAQLFYKEIEEKFKIRILEKRELLRLIKSQEEAMLLKKRMEDPLFNKFINNTYPCLYSNHFQDAYGSFSIDCVYTLNIPLFLDASKFYFESKNVYREWAVDAQCLDPEKEEILFNNVLFKHIIFCDGFSGYKNPFFSWLPFRPAKGEILTLDLLKKVPSVIVNKEKWIIPIGETRVKIGATYSWDISYEGDTYQGKGELLKAFNDITRELFIPLVIKQDTAIRPCTQDAEPFLGMHPKYPHLIICNGFGSKGSLLAPFYTQALAFHLRDKTPLPKQADIYRYIKLYK